MLDCCFTNNYRECHRDTVYSTVVTCLLQLIDDADVSLLALQLAEKLRSEVCTKIDSSV